MPRVVADTTVLVSAFLTPRGVASELLRSGRQGDFRIVLSPAILEETRHRLLHRRKIRRRYPYSDDRVRRFDRLLRTTSLLVTDPPPVTGVVRDPNDDMVIACALGAQAHYIVTRDKDLLTLGEHEGIRILTPRQFLERIGAPGAGRPAPDTPP